MYRRKNHALSQRQIMKLVVKVQDGVSTGARGLRRFARRRDTGAEGVREVTPTVELSIQDIEAAMVGNLVLNVCQVLL